MKAYQALFVFLKQKILVDPVLLEELHYLLETAAAVMMASHYLEVSGLISAHYTRLIIIYYNIYIAL